MGDPDIETLVREFLSNGVKHYAQFVEDVAHYCPKIMPTKLADEFKRNRLVGELAAAEARARALRSELGV